MGSEMCIRDRPGAKYYYWEMKGVPLRIELGPRDLNNNSCVFVRRDDFRKTQVPLNTAVPEVKKTLDDIQRHLYARAKEKLVSNIRNISIGVSVSEKDSKMDELRKAVRSGIISLTLCDNESCGKELEDTLGVSVLGEVYEDKEVVEREEGEGSGKKGCVICTRSGSRVLAARTY